MYCGERESKYLSFSLKLELHPSTLAHLSNTICSSSLPKLIPLGPMDGNLKWSLAGDCWCYKGALVGKGDMGV
jgi:hypothetical protein